MYNPFHSVELTRAADDAWRPVLVLRLRRARPGGPPRDLLLAADGRRLAQEVAAGTLPVGVFCDWLDDHLSTVAGDCARDVSVAIGVLRHRGGFFAGPAKPPRKSRGRPVPA